MTLSFQFGTVGSPSGTPKKPGGSVGAIEFSKSIGLSTLELGWVQSVRVTEATCAAIKAQAEQEMEALRTSERGTYTVRGCLLHVLEHYSEHLGQMWLTRQLCENKNTRPHEI